MDNVILEKLTRVVEKELDQLIAKNSLTPAELDTANKAVELMACIKGYEAMIRATECEEPMYSEMSMGHGKYSMRYPMHMNSYGEPAGYSSTRRDSMGRYSGHSIKDRMIDRLERMMDEAGSEYERKEIMDEIARIRQSN